MFAVLAEDNSDLLTIKQIIWKICGTRSVPILGKGFGCGSELLKDGTREAKTLLRLDKVKTLIVCHDADALDDVAHRQAIELKILNQVNFGEKKSVAVVPISMIESWLLADVNACRAIFKGLGFQKEIENPEHEREPKSKLERICRDGAKPKYSNATHNHLIAPHLDLHKVYKRCKSFRPLAHAVDEAFHGVNREQDFWLRRDG